MCITEKEFQEALIIVNTYIKNFNDNLSKINRTPIKEWVDYQRASCKELTNNHKRLFNALTTYPDKYEYIEDVDIKK